MATVTAAVHVVQCVMCASPIGLTTSSDELPEITCPRCVELLGDGATL